MKEEATKKTAYHFTGVSVLVPEELDSEIVAVSERIPHDIPDNTGEQGEPDSFERIRNIANIVLYERENFDTPVQNFSPPIEFRVHYNFYDLCKTGKCDITDLKLAYWDGEKWVIISDEAHEYQIFPPSTAQVAEAKIWSWVGDPTLAWGK